MLANVGQVRLAVTTNLNINFLRRPAPADLIGEARLIKLGKRLAVGEVAISSQRRRATSSPTRSGPTRFPRAAMMRYHDTVSKKTPVFPAIPSIWR